VSSQVTDVSDEPASLLTKTQRERIADGFQSVEGAKRRRDRQRIRRRVAAGIGDFEYLVEYPDEQLAAAFDDRDDEAVERALAEMRIVGERIRLVHDLDREAVVARAQDRLRETDADEGTLEAVELWTREEVERTVAAELAAEHEPSAWKRRSELALKIGTVLALPGVLLVPVPFGAVPPAIDGAVVFVALVFGGPALAFGLSVLLARSLKYDLVPALRGFVDDPGGTVRAIWNRL
jgi:hypothetical protein